jgi:hypothetical protein
MTIKLVLRRQYPELTADDDRERPMISKMTATNIALWYREIETAEKLL